MNMKLKVNNFEKVRTNIFSPYSVINNETTISTSEIRLLEIDTCLSGGNNVDVYYSHILHTKNKSFERTQENKDVAHWANQYQELINNLSTSLEKGKLKSSLKHTFSKYKLKEFLGAVEFISDEMDDKIIFYSLINMLSKYPYIQNFNGCKSYSVSPQGFINLSIIKTHKNYSSILNLEFCADGKITFNTHDDEVNDFLLHGLFISPKKYLSNRKFKLLLRLLDD